METMKALALGAANRGKDPRVFDWDKAAKLIKERKPNLVEAGLEEDMEWTAGTIYENGKIVKNDYTYLSSTWATPVVVIDGDIIECWKMGSETKFKFDTKWPKSAIEIMEGGMK